MRNYTPLGQSVEAIQDSVRWALWLLRRALLRVGNAHAVRLLKKARRRARLAPVKLGMPTDEFGTDGKFAGEFPSRCLSDGGV